MESSRPDASVKSYFKVLKKILGTGLGNHN